MKHASRGRIKSQRKLFLLSIVLVLSAAYLISIRYGTLGDIGVYLDAGKAIAQQKDPYLGDFRSGPVGAIAIYIFSTLVPAMVIEVTFQLLNLAGIYYFARKILPQINADVFLVVLVLLTWSSPVREMLFIHQLNGIAIGLMTLSLFPILKKAPKFLCYFVQGTFLLVSIELKPQLVIPIAIYIIMRNQRNIISLYALTVGVFFHFALNQYTGLPLELLALKKILSISAVGSQTKWKEVTNIWPVLDYFFPAYIFWYICAVIISIVSILIILQKSKSLNSVIPLRLCAIFPAITIYSQLHQMIFLSILMCSSIVINRVNLLSVISFLFLLVPLEMTEPRNLIFLTVASITLYGFKKYLQKKQSIVEICSYFVAGIAVLVPLHKVILGFDPWTIQITSRIVTSMAILGLLIIIEMQAKNQEIITEILT